MTKVSISPKRNMQHDCRNWHGKLSHGSFVSPCILLHFVLHALRCGCSRMAYRHDSGRAPGEGGNRGRAPGDRDQVNVAPPPKRKMHWLIWHPQSWPRSPVRRPSYYRAGSSMETCQAAKTCYQRASAKKSRQGSSASGRMGSPESLQDSCHGQSPSCESAVEIFHTSDMNS